MGVICGIGRNLGLFRDSLMNGQGGIRPITSTELGDIRFRNGSEVVGYNPSLYFDARGTDFLDRFAQFAVIAAREAVSESGIRFNPELREATAVVTGSCVGGQSSEDASFRDIYHLERNRVHPLTIPRIMANAGASHISIEFGITGPAYTVSTACASATHAIGQAFGMVRSGAVEMAIAGGSEAPFSFGLLRAWEAMRVVSQTTCRPFSKNRSGMILGEGAAMFVLEPMEAAQARGATILGEVAGFGMSSDANHITQPSADGAARAMRMALRDAGIQPNQVGYVNAHGTGTQANDMTETRAIRTVFGSYVDRLPVSSTKSSHGHALGSAGALEAAATVLALREGLLPPTLNFEEPDSDCDLNLVIDHARLSSAEYAISNSFAFGGLNAVLAFRKY